MNKDEKQTVTPPDLTFQISDWNYYHEDTIDNKKFVIRLFGKTSDGKTVYTKVTDYQPYFYVEVPKKIGPNMVDCLMDEIKKRVYPKDNVDSLKLYKVVKRHDLYKGFVNNKLFNYFLLKFSDMDGLRAYERAFKHIDKVTGEDKGVYLKSISYTPIKFSIFESNMEPILRCMHIQKLSACGWAKINGGEYKNIEENDIRSCCDINISAKWTSLKNIESNKMTPLVIASYDLECTSKDGSFPLAKRDSDAIIQIGTTFSRFGEKDCFYRHIITLGTCDNLEGTTVESYDNEEDVLIAWTKLLRRTNPDIITGYNIFGFDNKYLHGRAKKLGIQNKFARLGRINNEQSKYIKKKLQSAGLGDNRLKYYEQTGRVQFDLMKVIMKDYQLPSYKLDAVASYFIKETVTEIKINNSDNTTTISSKNTYGARKGQYITITYNDGISDDKHMDGKKFQILEVTDKTIKVSEKIDTDIVGKGYKIYWCQAKDDIHPNEIFKCQKGSSKDRAKIAKYCVQDCELCNTLVAKLQIISNNVGMSNVCSVPLSYLFLRGQGIKIFSLVSRKCREKGFLIPVIRKPYKKEDNKEIDSDDDDDSENKDKKEKKKLIDAKKIEEQERIRKENMRLQRQLREMNNKEFDILAEKEDGNEEEDDDGYEGATVLEPTKGVHYDPIAVVDYSSLYPRSMIHRNLSHECIVLDPQYDNLPGYIYHEATYNNNDGTTTTKRFAQKYDNEKGLIPGILPEISLELLDARTKTKKLMEEEKDPFMKMVLNGLQLAYKVTANSLYGQTGASVSAIYMKDIAACTTATGREMLLFSKYCMEIIYYAVVNFIAGNKIKLEHFDKMFTTAQKQSGEYFKTFPKLFTDTFISKFIKIDKKTPLNLKLFKQFIRTFVDYVNDPKLTYDKLMELLLSKVPDKKFNTKKKGWENKEQFLKVYKVKIKECMEGKEIDPEVIYGDTDSTFNNFRLKDTKTGKRLQDRTALATAIQLGIMFSNTIFLFLPSTHDQSYEKTMWPLILLSKKRYAGNLYEFDLDHFYLKYMGIVLKRRDNAQIVKIVCGGIIDQILNKRSAKGAIEYTQKMLHKILSGEFSIDKFIITKTLKSGYKNRKQIVHAVLADRMAERDPGNKPAPNERIPYVYIEVDHEVELQGERVEHPDYVIEKKLKIDYLFYITNQIMKPAIQFLEHLAENPQKIFDDYIIREENRRKHMRPLTYYFKNEKSTEVEDIEIKLGKLKEDDLKITYKPSKRRMINYKIKKANLPRNKDNFAEITAELEEFKQEFKDLCN